MISNGQTVTDSRFFMDNDNDAGPIPTALPIDVCFNSNGAPPTRYTRYTCNNNQVTKTKYTDPDCTDQDGGSQLFTQSTPCGLYSFSCSNQENEYMDVGAYFNFIGNDDQCQNLQSAIPSVIGCFCVNATNSYQSSCTSNTEGGITVYDSASDCTGSSTFEDLSVCTLVDDSIINVYSKIAGCSLQNKGNYSHSLTTMQNTTTTKKYKLPKLFNYH